MNSFPPPNTSPVSGTAGTRDGSVDAALQPGAWAAAPPPTDLGTGFNVSEPTGPVEPKRRFGVVRALFELRTWKETAHLLLDLPLGIAWFTATVTMLSLSFGLMVTFVGFPLLMVTIAMGRWFGVVERRRAQLLLGATFPGFRKLDLSGTWGERVKRVLKDGPGWKGLLYGILMLPWGIFTFVVTVVLWSVGLSGLTFPLYGWALPVGGNDDGDFAAISFGPNSAELHGWEKGGVIAAVGLVGLVVVLVTPWVIRGLASVHRQMIGAAFAPDRELELTERVERLTESRDASVEGSAQELRRIERDLHDGAQQRLVGLAMELGLAKERMQNGSDPARALESVTRAHEEAKGAIGDLRNLVRGIHPSVLTDRGLDAALSAVAARSPIPVELDIELPERLPAPIEAAAYFVVTEALANVSKHAQANCATVKVARRGDRLFVHIADDGRGGAMVHPGGGLAGLRDRVVAVEGRFRVASPEGGPTLLEAVIPCGS
jgi:signal transduction histidine kinase